MAGGIYIPAEVLQDKRLNHTHKILYGVILSRADKKEKSCSDSNQTLGDLIERRRSTVSEMLQDLANLGHVNIESGTQRKIIPVYTDKPNAPKEEIKTGEKNIRKKEMLEVFRKDERLVRFMNEEDVIRWWEHKQASKKPYKDVSSFMRAMVKIKNTIKYYGDTLKSDRDIRNRFNYAVTEAIDGGREGLNRYDSMEQPYENSKNDLYPNPKQNE